MPPTFAENKADIAFVKPVFTSSAYQTEGFYDFYRKFGGSIGAIYAFTRYLNVSVTDSWLWSSGLGKFAASKDMQRFLEENRLTATVITDIDVHEGRIDHELLVVGFDEYVTQQQYDNYRKFLQNGGKIILFDPTHFLAEVAYDEKTNTVRLVKGHNWEFNGRFAQPSVFHRWYKENTEIFGGNFVLYVGSGNYHFNGAVFNTTHPLSLLMQKRFGNSPLFTSYHPHEENNMTNPYAKPIAYWQVEGVNQNVKVAIYEHFYGKGSVIGTSVFASQLADEEDFKYFFFEAVRYLLKSKDVKLEEQIPVAPNETQIIQNTTKTVEKEKQQASEKLQFALIAASSLPILIYIFVYQPLKNKKTKRVAQTSLFFSN